MQGRWFACGVRTRSGCERTRRGLVAASIASAAIALAATPALAKPPADRVLVNEYAGIEGAHLGLTLPGGPEHFITVTDSPKFVQTVHEYGKTFPAGAVTNLTYNSSGTELTSASITIYGIAHSEGNALIRGVVAHETFHVFEALMSGSMATDDSHQAWLIEGAAEWVESELVPNDRVARQSWKEYLHAPTKALFARDYDGVGLFGHMVASHINPWTRFKSMFATTSSAAAYAAAGVTKTFLDDEASIFFRDPGLGHEWDQTGRNVPSAGAVGFKPVQVNATGKPIKPLVIAPYADGAYELNIHGLPSTKPVLEVNVARGNVRLRSTGGGSVNDVDPAQVLLCSDPKGCSCPSRPNHYPQFQRGDLAITGGSTGGEVELVARAVRSAPARRLVHDAAPRLRATDHELRWEIHRNRIAQAGRDRRLGVRVPVQRCGADRL
jgi:hypothetical protein